MPSIVLDFDPPQTDAPGFCGDQSDLVHFLSFAYAARFGAQHELSLLALTLQTDFKINLKPLLTFADREVEEPEDEETLNAAWQESRPLAERRAAAVRAIDSADTRLHMLLADYPSLRDRLADLAKAAHWAETRKCRIRVTYRMSDDQQ